MNSLRPEFEGSRVQGYGPKGLQGIAIVEIDHSIMDNG